MNWKTYFTTIAITALVAGATTWKVQSWRCQAKLVDITATHQIEINAKDEALQAMKDAATHQLQAQQTQQQEQAKRIAALDAKHYKELRHVQNEVSSLRADLASGQRRLHVDTVSARNSASGRHVPGYPNTASVDDGTVRTELHPEIARRLIGTTGDADECAVKLTALQKWVLTHQ